MKKKQNQKKKLQQKPSLMGKGDYHMTTSEYDQLSSKLDKIDSKIPSAKKIISNAGSAVGGLFGNSGLGRSLAEKASALVGFGDYQIQTNSLMKNYTSDGIIPKFYNGGNGVRIREREYLGDILSSATPGAFKNTSYPITPTDITTFPWLSSVAKLYDQWEPNGIVFEFVSTSSDFNGSAQGLGSLIMATDYDCTDAPYTTKVLMDNADYSTSAKPSINQIHGIECDPSQRPYKTMYTRGLNVPAANRNTIGNFQIATSGVSAASVALGELWVSYDITFYKKQLDQTLLLNLNLTGSTTAGAFGVITAVNNNNGWSWSVPSTAPNQLIINFPINVSSGRYLALGFWTLPTGIALNQCIGPANTNLTVVSYRETGSQAGNPTLYAVLFNVSAPNASILFYNVGVTGGFSFSITQVSSDYSI